MRRLTKIALCLPLLFLDINQLPENSTSNYIVTESNYLKTGWGWRFSVNSVVASDVEHIPVYGTRPPSYNWWSGGRGWDQTDCWYCDNTDSGGGGDYYYAPEPTVSADDQAWSVSSVTNATKVFIELKLALAAQLASLDLHKDSALLSELTRQHKAVSLVLEVLQSGGTITNNILNNKLGHATADIMAVLAGIGAASFSASILPSVLLGAAASYAASAVGYAVADYVNRRIEQLGPDHNWNRQCAEWRSIHCHLQP